MPRKSRIIFVLGLATLALGLLIVVVPFTLSTHLNPSYDFNTLIVYSDLPIEEGDLKELPSSQRSGPLHWLISEGERVRDFRHAKTHIDVPFDAVRPENYFRAEKLNEECEERYSRDVHLEAEDRYRVTYVYESNNHYGCYHNRMDIPYSTFLCVGSTLSIVGLFVAIGVYFSCRFAQKENSHLSGRSGK
jgi:hypothetical protein